MFFSERVAWPHKSSCHVTRFRMGEESPCFLMKRVALWRKTSLRRHAFFLWREYMQNTANSVLSHDPVGKLMVRYSLPCIISLLVGALYNIVDQIFIANAPYLGSYGNAANTVVFPLTVIALAIAVMIGDGCCAFVSINMGSGRKETAAQSVGNAILLSVFAGVSIMIVYTVFQERLLSMFGARVNQETFSQATEYFRYITMGIPLYVFGQAMNPVIRSDGSPRYAMVSLMVGAILNCFLDPLFIFVFHWGMMGAAVATVIGQAVGALLSCIYLLRMKNIILEKKSFRFDRAIVFRMMTLGFSSFLAQISMVLSMAAVLNMIKTYGALDPVFGQPALAQIPTAVVGIVMKFFQIIISVAIGLAAGCIPVIGYNAGAGCNERVRQLLVRLLVAESCVGVVATCFFQGFPHTIIGWFGAANESPYYREFAVHCIRIFLSLVVLSCVNKSVSIFLQALGKAKLSCLLSLLREIFCGVGLPLLLPRFFGLDGILYFMPVSDIVTCVASVFAVVAVYRELMEEQCVGAGEKGRLLEKRGI